MSRVIVISGAAVACIAGAWAFFGCGESAKTPAMPDSPAKAVARGTAPLVPPPDAKILADQTKSGDEDCRGLLDSFQRRAYDPRRDARLEHAEGTIEVHIDGAKDAKYRFVFDAAKPAKAPVEVETVSEPAGLKPGLLVDVRRWAVLSCVGGYALVVVYRPPIPLAPVPSSKKGSFTIYAPPFKTPAAASYSIDERQVVEARGEWTDPKNKFVTNYEWDFWHGFYLLRRSIQYGGPTSDFEYDDRNGPKLLAKIHVRDGDRRTEAVITYENVRIRPK